MLPVFLSASEPYETRLREFWETRQLVNIRAAVSAVCAHVLEQGPLVFGGHPNITPMARDIADGIRHDYERDYPDEPAPAARLLMFQSRLWVREGSDDVIVTEAHKKDGAVADTTGSRNVSLLRMRYEMLGYENAEPVHPLLQDYRSKIGQRRVGKLGTSKFRAAFFVGGMEGVIHEFRIFRSFHPHTPAYPLASTGAAAEKLLPEAGISNENLKAALQNDTAYSVLLEQLLPDDPQEFAPEYRWEPRSASARYSVDDHIDPENLDEDMPLKP